MTTRLTSQHAWKHWHEARSALVRPKGPDQSTRQMANLPQVYIARFFKRCVAQPISGVFSISLPFLL